MMGRTFSAWNLQISSPVCAVDMHGKQDSRTWKAFQKKEIEKQNHSETVSIYWVRNIIVG